MNFIKTAIRNQSRFFYSFLIAAFFLSTFSFGQKAPDTSRYKEIYTSIQNASYAHSLSLIRAEFEKQENISAELIYLYGRSLYGNGDYVLSRKAFQQYLSQSTTQDLYFLKEAEDFLEKLTHKICSKCNNTGSFLAEADCGKCLGKGIIVSNCTHCKEKGTVLCKTCKGNGVIIQNSNFGKSFTQCPECTGKGFKPCNHCLGDGELEKDCDICSGNGKVPTPTPCNHNF